MKGDIENAAFIIGVWVIITLSIGEPDLMDAIIYWLTDGKFQPTP